MTFARDGGAFCMVWFVVGWNCVANREVLPCPSLVIGSDLPEGGIALPFVR